MAIKPIMPVSAIHVRSSSYVITCKSCVRRFEGCCLVYDSWVCLLQIARDYQRPPAERTGRHAKTSQRPDAADELELQSAASHHRVGPVRADAHLLMTSKRQREWFVYKTVQLLWLPMGSCNISEFLFTKQRFLLTVSLTGLFAEVSMDEMCVAVGSDRCLVT